MAQYPHRCATHFACCVVLGAGAVTWSCSTLLSLALILATIRPHMRASPHDKTLLSVPDHVLDERGQPHHVRHSSADDQREKIPSEGVRMLFRLTARVFQPLSPIGMNEDLELGHAPPGAIPEAFAMGRRPRSLPSPMAFRSDRTHMRCAELMEELLY